MTRRIAKRSSMPEPDGPAVVGPDMVRTRVLSPAAGTPKGWKRKSPLESAYDKNQLAGGSSRYLADDRYQAGVRYRELFDTAQASGRDSTQALMAAGSGWSGLPLSQAQATAIKALVAVESHMGARDRQIARMVCCEGYWPSEAVRTVCQDYQDKVGARFREALDALCDAFDFMARGKR